TLHVKLPPRSAPSSNTSRVAPLCRTYITRTSNVPPSHVASARTSNVPDPHVVPHAASATRTSNVSPRGGVVLH
ncbi:hypothetical protein A2U01_0061286, partial [Trifolium medium]|nr:hypothetical protein [Trifolium medium]